VCMAYNSQYHESIGYSPYEIVYGRPMTTPLEADLTITEDTERFDEHIECLRSKLKEIKQVTQHFQEKRRNKQKLQYDKKTSARKFYVGQKVYLYVPQIKRYRVKKLSKLWRGPYRIIRVLSEHNVTIRVRKRDVTVHVNRLKPVFDTRNVNNECSVVVETEELADEGSVISDKRDKQGVDLDVQPSTSYQQEPVNTGDSTRTQCRPQRTRRQPTGLRDFVMD
jgi:hypothetical protein